MLGDDEGGAGAAVFITAVGRCVAEAGPPGAGACAPTRKRRRAAKPVPVDACPGEASSERHAPTNCTRGHARLLWRLCAVCMPPCLFDARGD